ncbi:hypothetical protein SNOG_14231 [Parastagonospora nodorum SN15]|uniref:Probable 26S proteasome regulatory subunit p27 n=1 Tax=Phaeosphaeria nodorum (strain SN15 / ATCC MYA-4574 / FGSC 10173) TaxID=321614 RepID=Q0U266_PHANO|nr:hypothetical protein SNOG_14231 [Parastagonospora nodorum SN15]EAT78468.2 hypothetical protein SNOG_14231 [Parastagonospora nodorum SN15]
MDDLHTPTVASGPTSGGYSNGVSKDQLSLQELIAEKDRLETELKALGQVLDSVSAWMQCTCVVLKLMYSVAWREHEHGPHHLRRLPAQRHRRAPEYAPPSDTAQLSLTSGIVRTTRARIIRLKNDYKDLMSRIEKGLHEHHARLAEQAQSDPEGAARAQASFEATPAALEAPFAKVNSVVADSPAELAGLRVGDTITKFGWVDWTNHERLSRVAEAVSQNEGLPIAVKALRPTASGGPAETVQMTLTPRRNWGGRGMLGCHLLPL